MMFRTFLAPAKINLCLHVLGKRPDGYHEVAMLMQRISLYDRLSIRVSEGEGVEVECPGVELPPGGENIAARAAARLLALSRVKRRVAIRIDKQIPVAAGLGGGSSDAAAVLAGLDAMLGLGLDRRTLMAEGARLGADVPFFLFPQTAWATGIGDVLEPVEGLPPVWYVLVNPGVAVSTAWVYGNLRLTSPREAASMPRFPLAVEGLVRLLHNDLEPVTTVGLPVVAAVKRELLASGAVGALMSGSGPTVFGVFAAEAQARQAARELERHPGWRVFVAQPL